MSRPSSTFSRFGQKRPRLTLRPADGSDIIGCCRAFQPHSLLVSQAFISAAFAVLVTSGGIRIENYYRKGRIRPARLNLLDR